MITSPSDRDPRRRCGGKINLLRWAVGVLRLQLIEVDRLRDELESTNFAGAALRLSSP